MKNVAIVFVLLFLIVLPAFLTLSTVKVPLNPQFPPGVEPSPYGYTVSLLLWIVPIIVLGFWLIPEERLAVPRKAFFITVTMVFLLGAMLDFLFAQYFFTFPNPRATLGIPAPALGGPVPIEEYIFYLSGATALILLYIWFNEYWLLAYKPNAPRRVKLLQIHWGSVLVAVTLIAAAWLYKNFFTGNPGFPGYFTFMVLTSMLPSALLLPGTAPRINWRAFSATLFFVLLVSLLWEVTLGLPYGWWGYEPKPMIGIYIDAWSSIPAEEVLLYPSVTYAGILGYTAIHAWLDARKGVTAA